MLRIHQLVAGEKFPNVRTVAAEFATSTKTIKRDFQYMRDHFDLPFEYDRQRHGYYYSKPVDKFPGAPSITEAEMFALLVAHKAIAQYHGTPFHQPLQMAFKKLTGQLDKNERFTLEHFHEALSFRPLAPEDADLQTFQTISRALQERRALKFLYRKPGQKSASLRQVHPYHMTCSDNRWYILAHDPDCGEVRTFALGRITTPVLTERRFTGLSSGNALNWRVHNCGVASLHRLPFCVVVQWIRAALPAGEPLVSFGCYSLLHIVPLMLSHHGFRSQSSIPADSGLQVVIVR